MSDRDPPFGPDEERPDHHGPDADFERRWAEIVAGYGEVPTSSDDESGADERRASEDPAETTDSPGTDTDGHGRRDPVAEGTDQHGHEDGPWHERTEEFIPPDPPAVASGRPAMVLSVAALVGAPLALLIAAILVPSLPVAVGIVLIAVFVAGAVGLFVNLPTDRDRREDGPDDGARL